MSKLFFERKPMEGYRNWIISNSQYLDSIENLSRVAIYLTVGRIDKSQVLTELCITLTKLVNFFNDQIVSSVSQGTTNPSAAFVITENGDKSVNYSRAIFTIIEHVKVLLELITNKIWGLTGKSTLIFFILVLRCCIQFYLLFWKNVKLHDFGPLPPLEKRDVPSKRHHGDHTGNHVIQNQAAAVTLNSGRRIQGIRSEPRSDSQNTLNEKVCEERITKLLLLGKVLTIARPVAHFTLMTYLGEVSWIPWMAALMTDILALAVLNQKTLIPLEKAQIEMWKEGLFMYLLRPPFFNKLKTVIHPFLQKLKLYSPSVVYLVAQLLSLITEWQKIYFHIWD